MEIRRGFATEYARVKMDVTVDDREDLPRICAEYGIDPALQSKMTVVHKYLLLNALAEWLVSAEAINVAQDGERAQAEQQAATAMEKYKTAVDAVRMQLGLQPLFAAQQPAQGQPGA